MKKVTNTKLGKRFELSEDECRALLDRAEKAMINTYPESNKGYAVAVLTKSGNVYEGISYESRTYTLTMHSEATALANAAIHGEKDIVAITGPNCHICKQLIYESSLNSGIDITIVIEEGKTIKQIPVSALMPYPWPEKKI
jgi:cytidine deaminase